MMIFSRRTKKTSLKRNRKKFTFIFHVAHLWGYVLSADVHEFHIPLYYEGKIYAFVLHLCDRYSLKLILDNKMHYGAVWGCDRKD